VQDVLRFISSLRNLLQPVNRLPPEILSQIVRYVPHRGYSNTQLVVPPTHVCRYWRESIISTPGNWTLISNRFKNLTALSLERAKAASLEISLDMHVKTPEFFDLLLPYMKNAVTFRAHAISAIDDLTEVFPKFPWSMPALQSLELYTRDEGDWDRSIDPFKSSVHTLRYLELVLTWSTYHQVVIHNEPATGPKKSYVDRHPPLPLTPLFQNSRNVVPSRLPVQPSLGHPFELFGGEPLA